MIDRIGFAPAPPLLVPEVASGAASELDELRGACDELLANLLADHDHLVLVTSHSAVQLGQWLVNRADWHGAVDTVELTAPDRAAASTLRALAKSHSRSAVLVLGDGSACRTLKAPGYLDERAAPFDDLIANHLSSADAAGLASLDPSLAEELLVAGRITWPTIAELVVSDQQQWIGDLTYRDDPYGVSYFVALWKPTD